MFLCIINWKTEYFTKFSVEWKLTVGKYTNSKLKKTACAVTHL